MRSRCSASFGDRSAMVMALAVFWEAGLQGNKIFLYLHSNIFPPPLTWLRAPRSRSVWGSEDLADWFSLAGSSHQGDGRWMYVVNILRSSKNIFCCSLTFRAARGCWGYRSLVCSSRCWTWRCLVPGGWRTWAAGAGAASEYLGSSYYVIRSI